MFSHKNWHTISFVLHIILLGFNLNTAVTQTGFFALIGLVGCMFNIAVGGYSASKLTFHRLHTETNDTEQ